MVVEIRFDPEMARIASGCHRLPGMQAYVIGRAYVADGSGRLTVIELKAILESEGVGYSRTRLRQILVDNHGLFWNYNAQAQIVYFAGVIKVAERLTLLAVNKGLGDLLKTNRPGGRQVVIPTDGLGGGKGRFAAMVYTAWFESRNEPMIARETLCSLFNCDEATLHRWEKRLSGIIAVTPNTAHASKAEIARDREALPPYAYFANGRWNWRLPSTYRVNFPGLRTYHRIGQARKIRGVVNKELELPASQCAGGQSCSRSFYDSPEKLRKALNGKHGHRRVRYQWVRTTRDGRGWWRYYPPAPSPENEAVSY